MKKLISYLMIPLEILVVWGILRTGYWFACFLIEHDIAHPDFPLGKFWSFSGIVMAVCVLVELLCVCGIIVLAIVAIIRLLSLWATLNEKLLKR
jgi:hypothetical protein